MNQLAEELPLTWLCPEHTVAWVCPYCGARWEQPPARDRRTAPRKRYGCGERRKRTSITCCREQLGLLRLAVS